MPQDMVQRQGFAAGKLAAMRQRSESLLSGVLLKIQAHTKTFVSLNLRDSQIKFPLHGFAAPPKVAQGFCEYFLRIRCCRHKSLPARAR
jgi:hypothetical protein